MSRLTDLIRQVQAKDPQLAADLSTEVKALSARRAFGLNFERHVPEAVELPRRAVRTGDKVRVLPPRGSTRHGDQRPWVVTQTDRVDAVRVAHLALLRSEEPETRVVPVEDLVVLAEFRDPIYPGLRSTGRVERGGEKPFHVVINSENYHALRTLLYTHRGGVDAIYIDPPYNTGARDWKYNNDYVEADDLYRHSKWLAFMERRLKLAKEMLNPADSVVIITIDEKEHLRLGLLLEQVFPESTIQMVTTSIKPSGSQRTGEFSRVEEYIFFVMSGAASPGSGTSDMLRDSAGVGEEAAGVTWHGLRRRGSTDWRRTNRPNGFYPLFVEHGTGHLHSVGEPLPLEMSREEAVMPPGTFAVWPLDPRGQEGRWQVSPARLRSQLHEGTAALKSADPATGTGSVIYLKGGDLQRILRGEVNIIGREPDGRIRVDAPVSGFRRPKTMWLMESHDASAHGTVLLSRFIPDRRFPFPKSLYAVEDSLRFFIKDKPNAVVVDFFAGSGTTAHAVMRLNRQDGGCRRSVSVTNNEVSSDEQRKLRQRSLRPGDEEWEAFGICRYITQSRITAAVTGETPGGESIKGDYRFNQHFPMSEGLEENVEFFDLTYEDPRRVSHNRAFSAVAPLLWLRAGGRGRRIDCLDGWEVADTYGILEDLDYAPVFSDKIAQSSHVGMVFIVTDDDRRYQMVCAALPRRVEPVRLYESYLQSFELVEREP